MPESPGRAILSVNLTQEIDFLLARQRAKQIAGLLGFDLQDQTRIATAVSEIARNAFEYAGGGRVEYFLDPTSSSIAGNPQLRIVIADRGQGIANLQTIWAGEYQSPTGMGLGIIGARRLLDELDLATGSSGTVATLVKRLPRLAPAPPGLGEIAASLAQTAPSKADAHVDQNRELLTLLTELRARETELQTLNRELEETNRGVLVLYAELEDRAQSVQETSEMKTRFLSGVTHELRTPLNSIVSLSRLLLNRTDGDLNAEQTRQVNFILRSAQNLTEMVNDLLDLARIEAGKTSVNLSDFTVAGIFAGLRGMFRPLALNENVKLIFEMPPHPIHLHSDEGKISQILRNFISNALKFTEQGTVTVSTSLASVPGSITFSVADTGIGIAAENLGLVMQDWGQVEEASHNKQKGSGLGLPLSRRLAELLGGHLDFTSTFGEGSTFSVTLPALVSPPMPVRTLQEPDQPLSHILVVSDDEVVRYLLRRHLSGFTSAAVHEVITGQQALDAVHACRPVILFVDLILAGAVTGAEVARQLRADPSTKELPIVLYTPNHLAHGERHVLEGLDLTVISKRLNTPQGDQSELSAQIERALLQVGLCNMHDAEAPQ